MRSQERLPLFEHWSKEKDFFSETMQRKAISAGIDIRFSEEAAAQMWAWLQTPTKTEEQV
jgi:hypothetical protein